MCFVALAEHMHTDRAQMPMMAYIYSLLVAIYIPNHKVVQT